MSFGPLSLSFLINEVGVGTVPLGASLKSKRADAEKTLRSAVIIICLSFIAIIIFASPSLLWLLRVGNGLKGGGCWEGSVNFPGRPWSGLFSFRDVVLGPGTPRPGSLGVEGLLSQQVSRDGVGREGRARPPSAG